MRKKKAPDLWSGALRNEQLREVCLCFKERTFHKFLMKEYETDSDETGSDEYAPVKIAVLCSRFPKRENSKTTDD